MVKEIRTRFAPSPTGYLHIGGIRTALFAWLFSRHHNGMFFLRIEDTDKDRSSQEAVDIILDGLDWLGLSPDEPPYYQSLRSERYQEVVNQLLESDNAYYCYCSKEDLDRMRTTAVQRGEKPRYDGHCRDRKLSLDSSKSHVVRFKNPDNGNVVISDLIQGEVSYKNSELDDLVIVRSDGTPTYNLTVVVDDMDMNISHVIRGDDHLNNTPRQINIFLALGAKLPEYAHIPLILDKDGTKLSKRNGAASVLHYRDKGILPNALLNYLVRLGWSHGDQEIFNIEEMINFFDLVDINKSASAINPEKLVWLNQSYLRESDSSDLAPLLKEQFKKHAIDYSDGPKLELVCEVQKERLKDLEEMAQESRFFYEDFECYDERAAAKYLKSENHIPLTELFNSLNILEEWSALTIQQTIEKVAVSLKIKLGRIAQPVRVAVTGRSVSPSIDLTLNLIGRQRVLNRLKHALEYIQQHA